MRPNDRPRAEQLERALLRYDQLERPLPGIQDPQMRAVLVEQLIDSLRRTRYISLICKRELSPQRADPNDPLFDPLKAAILHHRAGAMDEAFWLVFLMIHFGKHQRGGWRYLREIYGQLGGNERWDWRGTSNDVAGFRAWLGEHQRYIKRADAPGGFGHHRKYESLDAASPIGTGAVVESYVDLVLSAGDHASLMTTALAANDHDPGRSFHYLYQELSMVRRFGRLARFSYLCLVGNLGLAPIAANSPYMEGASGPLKGAKLLFGTYQNDRKLPLQLDGWLSQLGSQLEVGMQVLEDALCNWQKSPYQFKEYRD